jgi:hypothetical protein
LAEFAEVDGDVFGPSGAPQTSHLSLLSFAENKLIFDFLLDNYNILKCIFQDFLMLFYSEGFTIDGNRARTV